MNDDERVVALKERLQALSQEERTQEVVASLADVMKPYFDSGLIDNCVFAWTERNLQGRGTHQHAFSYINVLDDAAFARGYSRDSLTASHLYAEAFLDFSSLLASVTSEIHRQHKRFVDWTGDWDNYRKRDEAREARNNYFQEHKLS